MMTHKEALAKASREFWRISSGLDSDMEAAFRAYVEARGLVMVPRNPTRKMRSAGFMVDSIADIYHAMLAAAPDPFAQEERA